jgi:hypothetical protein
MEIKSYDKVDFEKIVLMLKEVLAYLQNKKLELNKENGKELTNTLVSGN